jgi:uncharacterized protein
MHHSTRLLGLFAKWPAPGFAKTRLFAANPVSGARVARAFLLDNLDRLTVIDARRVLAFTPPKARADFFAVGAVRFEIEPQEPGDLGQRLAAFFRRWIAAGAEAIVVLGTDSPTLPVQFVEDAFAALKTTDIVLGPATDGGYYLIGCGRQLPPVFEGIDWGTSRVLAQTIARLSEPARRVAVLPPWYDVDTAADWSMLAGHVAALRRAGIDPLVPHTEALLLELGMGLPLTGPEEGPCEG